jgi:hypothetical protein
MPADQIQKWSPLPGESVGGNRAYEPEQEFKVYLFAGSIVSAASLYSTIWLPAGCQQLSRRNLCWLGLPASL